MTDQSFPSSDLPDVEAESWDFGSVPAEHSNPTSMKWFLVLFYMINGIYNILILIVVGEDESTWSNPKGGGCKLHYVTTS